MPRILRLFNLFLGAYILGTVTMLVVKGDERSKQFRERMYTLADFSKTNELPQVGGWETTTKRQVLWGEGGQFSISMGDRVWVACGTGQVLPTHSLSPRHSTPTPTKRYATPHTEPPLRHEGAFGCDIPCRARQR